VDQIFCRVWSRCPLAVADVCGSCLLTAAVARPGQVVKYSRLMAAIQVDLTGLNAAAWRYLIMRRMPVWSWSTLAHWSVVGSGVCRWCLGVCIGNFHNPMRVSLDPVNTVVLSLKTTTLSLSNVASHPAAHSLPMETRELCVRPGSRCAWRRGSCV
jgi:hypothetical protein